MSLSVALLHDKMLNKKGELITASLTLIDIHDIARSSRTYGAERVYIVHPGEALQRLANVLKGHWEEGYGATYNPNRKEAIENVDILSDLDALKAKVEERTGKKPILVATSARPGEKRVTFKEMRSILESSDHPYVLLLGTGWGMCDSLLAEAQYFLEPINGPTEYNHLSVRSACAIMLDRLRG